MEKLDWTAIFELAKKNLGVKEIIKGKGKGKVIKGKGKGSIGTNYYCALCYAQNYNGGVSNGAANMITHLENYHQIPEDGAKKLTDEWNAEYISMSKEEQAKFEEENKSALPRPKSDSTMHFDHLAKLVEQGGVLDEKATKIITKTAETIGKPISDKVKPEEPEKKAPIEEKKETEEERKARIKLEREAKDAKIKKSQEELEARRLKKEMQRQKDFEDRVAKNNEGVEEANLKQTKPKKLDLEPSAIPPAANLDEILKLMKKQIEPTSTDPLLTGQNIELQIAEEKAQPSTKAGKSNLDTQIKMMKQSKLATPKMKLKPVIKLKAKKGTPTGTKIKKVESVIQKVKPLKTL